MLYLLSKLLLALLLILPPSLSFCPPQSVKIACLLDKRARRIENGTAHCVFALSPFACCVCRISPHRSHHLRRFLLSVNLDYVCFDDCPDVYVVGFGMDGPKSSYRCCPFVSSLKPEAYAKPKKQ